MVGLVSEAEVHSSDLFQAFFENSILGTQNCLK
jgi:hypothetical protein